MSVLSTLLLYLERGIHDNYYKMIFVKALQKVQVMTKLKGEQLKKCFAETALMVLNAIPQDGKVVKFIKKILRIISSLLFVYAIFRSFF